MTDGASNSKACNVRLVELEGVNTYVTGLRAVKEVFFLFGA